MDMIRRVVAFDAAHLGAESALMDLTAGEGHQVCVDPAGHPFCIGWGQPDEEAVRPFTARLG